MGFVDDVETILKVSGDIQTFVVSQLCLHG